MTAAITQAAYVANLVSIAAARGVTDPLALAKIRTDAIDAWQSYLNTPTGVLLGVNPN